MGLNFSITDRYILSQKKFAQVKETIGETLPHINFKPAVV